MMTVVINFLLALTMMVSGEPSVSLSLTSVKGPAPLQTLATATVVGPYVGVVCFVILENEGTEYATNPWCEEDQPLDLKDSEEGKVRVELTGKVPGEYEVGAFLPDVTPHQKSELVKVVVEPEKVKAN